MSANFQTKASFNLTFCVNLSKLILESPYVKGAKVWWIEQSLTKLEETGSILSLGKRWEEKLSNDKLNILCIHFFFFFFFGGGGGRATSKQFITTLGESWNQAYEL